MPSRKKVCAKKFGAGTEDYKECVKLTTAEIERRKKESKESMKRKARPKIQRPYVGHQP